MSDKTILGMVQAQHEMLKECQRLLWNARAELDMIAVTLGYHPVTKPAEADVVVPYPDLTEAALAGKTALNARHGKNAVESGDADNHETS